MKQKIIFFITLLILVNLKAFSLENVNIVFKIDEEIITNIDVKKEAKFLVALNTNLETLNEGRCSLNTQCKKCCVSLRCLRFLIQKCTIG